MTTNMIYMNICNQSRILLLFYYIVIVCIGSTMAHHENISTIDLGNGAKIPVLGFGTWQSSDAEIMTALDEALKAGYRHIDTAYVYGNEDAIGKVLNEWLSSGKLKREELFIVTKLPPKGIRPDSVEKCLKKSLSDLQLNYVDLYLIHVPFGFKETEIGTPLLDENNEIVIEPDTDLVAVWKEMEKQYENGLTHSIGVSNFNSSQIERILNAAKIKPSNLQIELHLYFQQKELREYCQANNISITAYSPLGSRGIGALLKRAGIHKEVPDILSNPTVITIAKKHNVTSAQVALRYLIQLNLIAIPKSTNSKRIKENIDIFHFELDNDDMIELEKLDHGSKGRINDFSFLKGVEKHPEFPFKI